MGIYLGQLPPAEVARLKAELAETLIAHFCYPRFFDQRTQSLCMRPVDRAKRQEVWLYLSSVDFTAWNRVDLLSPDIQIQIERLFIQFVQRNRSFFGEQGRKRMSDIRMLINSCATQVVQGLRSHITGQKPANPAFGSPRPVISWGTQMNGHAELSWEQISAATMQLQQQLQEIRGEAKPAMNAAANAPATPARRPVRPYTVADTSSTGSTPVVVAPPMGARSNGQNGGRRVSAPLPPVPTSPTPAMPRPVTTPSPAATMTAPPTTPPVSTRPTGADSTTFPTAPVRKIEPSIEHTVTAPPVRIQRPEPRNVPPPSLEPTPLAPPPTPLARTLSQPLSAQPPATSTANGQLVVGEDDVAIFEQLRHQLLLWLRIESLSSGIEIASQSPAQLLEALRQQGRLDDTRLQVVSTLLNLANQVIKTGMVSLLDYKQALMFHLMHTRR